MKSAVSVTAARDSSVKRGRRTQAERTAESERRMLRAAMKLIGERGYKGTSMAAIGEEAGYSRGLISERFGSKDGLLLALVESMMRVWRRDVKHGGATHSPGVPQLCALLDNHRKALERYEPVRALYALMFEATGPTPQLLPEFQALHRGFREEIEVTLQAGMDAGTIRPDIDEKAQAVVLLGTIRGIGFQWLMERDAFPLESTYEELKRNLHRSLTP